MSKSAEPDRRLAAGATKSESLAYVSLAVAATFVVLALSQADRAVFSLVMPRIKAELHYSDAELGLLSGVPFALCFAFFGVPVAWLGDTRVRRTSVVALAVVIWSVMTVLCGVAAGFWSMFFLRMGVGAGEGGGTPAAMSVATDIAPEKWRRRVIAICGMGAIFGSVVGLVGSGWAVTHFGWRATFLVMGAPGILVALLYALIVSEPPRAATIAQVPRSFTADLKTLLSSKSYVLLFVGTSLMTTWLLGGVATWIPTFLSRAYNINMTEIGGVLGIATGLSGIGAPILYGWLGDRLAARDLRWPLQLCALSLCLAVIFFVLVLFAKDKVVVYALLVSFQFLIHGLAPLTVVAAQDLSPSLKATGLAILTVGSQVLSAFGPWGVGAISDHFATLGGAASLRLGLLATTPIAVLGVVAFWAAAQYLNPSAQRQAVLLPVE